MICVSCSQGLHQNISWLTRTFKHFQLVGMFSCYNSLFYTHHSSHFCFLLYFTGLIRSSFPLQKERAHIHLARGICMPPQSCVHVSTEMLPTSLGTLLYPTLLSAGRHPHIHRPRAFLPKVYSANHLHICPGPTLIPTGKPCQRLPGKGISFSPTQTSHGAWGWHRASPQDHVLPASSCAQAHCQLWEGTSPFSEEK